MIFAGAGSAEIEIDFSVASTPRMEAELVAERVGADSVEVRWRGARASAGLALERSVAGALFEPLLEIGTGEGSYRDALAMQSGARFRLAGEGRSPGAPVEIGPTIEAVDRASRDTAERASREVASVDSAAREIRVSFVQISKWVEDHFAQESSSLEERIGPVGVRRAGSLRLEVEIGVDSTTWVERRVGPIEGVFRRWKRIEPGSVLVDDGPEIAEQGIAVEYRLAGGGRPSAPIAPARVPPELCGVEPVSDRAVRVKIRATDRTVDGLLLFRKRIGGERAEARTGSRLVASRADLEQVGIPEGREARSEWVWIADLAPDEESWVDDGLALGEEVIYRLDSFRAGRKIGAAISEAPFGVAVEPPEGLAVAPGVGRRIVLRWSDRLDFETGYVIYRDQGMGDERIAELGPNSTTFVDSTLGGRGPWRYSVATRVETGETRRSRAAALRAEVRAPAELRGRLESMGRLMLEWEARGKTVTGFVVERRREGEPVFAVVDTVAPARPVFADSAVVAGGEVAYQVRTLGLTHRSAPSRVWMTRVPGGLERGRLVSRAGGGAARVGERPVTRSEYRLFCAATGRSAPESWAASGGGGTREGAGGDEDLPATGVSWGEATAYLNWVSGLLGLRPAYDSRGELDEGADGLRLPGAGLWAGVHGGGPPVPVGVMDDEAREGLAGGGLRGDEDLFGARSPMPRVGPGGGRESTDSGASFGLGREWLTDRFLPAEGPRAEGRRFRLVLERSGGGREGDGGAALLLPFDERARYPDIGFRVARAEK